MPVTHCKQFEDALALLVEAGVSHPGRAGIPGGTGHGCVPCADMDRRHGHLASDSSENSWAQPQQRAQKLSTSIDHQPHEEYNQEPRTQGLHDYLFPRITPFSGETDNDEYCM